MAGDGRYSHQFLYTVPHSESSADAVHNGPRLRHHRIGFIACCRLQRGYPKHHGNIVESYLAWAAFVDSIAAMSVGVVRFELSVQLWRSG